MRVLFLHCATNELKPEYKVHLTLASHAKGKDLDPYFIWQSPIPLGQMESATILSHDFGRDTTLRPKPNRYQRASLMIQKLPGAIAFLSAAIQQIKPDLIYTSQQNYDVFLGDLLSRAFHIPHVIHVHYNVGPWLGLHTLHVIRNSPRLIAVSEYIRQTATLRGALSTNIHTVPNPLPISQSVYDPKRPSVRVEFQLKDTTPLIVSVGRLDPGKGHLALFEAFAQVLQHIPEARLLICGSSTTRDHYEQRLLQRVQELQISDSVIFAGQRDDIPAILSSANVFCLPTELEPYGLVFLEAMSAGIPVVAYYSGGVPEVVLHNQTGLLSTPGDIHTLARNLIKILSDKNYARCLGNAGKQRVGRVFTPEAIADCWLGVLHEKAMLHAKAKDLTPGPFPKREGVPIHLHEKAKLHEAKLHEKAK